MSHEHFHDHVDLDEYDKHIDPDAPELLALIDEIVKAVPDEQGKTILETGSGTGRFSVQLLRNYKKAKLILTDPDPECLKRLEKRCSQKNVEIRQLPAEKLEGVTADALVMTEAFHHIPLDKQSKAMDLYSKALRPGGMLFIVDEFIEPYKDAEDRKRVLTESIGHWLKDAEASGDQKDLEMAQHMKKHLDDYGGESFISAEAFEALISGSGFGIRKRKVMKETGNFDWDTILYVLQKVG